MSKTTLCPKCNGKKLTTERRIDGYTICNECNYKDKTTKFENSKETNQDIYHRCPICSYPALDYQPESGTHCFTINYECGTSIDFPISGTGYSYSMKCNELTDIDCLKIRYRTGNYIWCTYNELKKHWFQEYFPNIILPESKHKLIHKKHKDILEAYLENGKSLVIQVDMYDDSQFTPEIEYDFIENYNECYDYKVIPNDSWFPEIDYVDHELESIINDRYEHFHTVDNTTGCCVTCGENIDNPDKKSKLIFNQDYYGEDLNDIVKDITFMYDDEVLKDIPDDQGILQGKFNVIITWIEE